MSDVPHVPKAVSNYFRQLGRKAKGEKKRREPAHYARMVEKRLANAKQATVESEKKVEV